MHKGRTVVVIGGGGLLGRALIQALADSRATVVVADTNFEAASALAQEHTARGGEVLAAAVNITSEESVLALLDAMHKRLGRIDGVVNTAYPRNARYGRAVEDVAYADFCDNVNLHLGGYFLVAQKVCQYFKARGGGSLVSLASVYGMIAPRFEIYNGTPMTMPVEYAAIKAGVIHLTKYFAQYYKTHGVRVNTVSPGGILDGQPEAFLARYRAFAGTRGMLDPGDVVGTVLFLLSDASQFVTGQNIAVDDGFSL
jgi:NAD(P)-dependent dehydrogenase (short-subunit alcohol dehydrogenase family)